MKSILPLVVLSYILVSVNGFYVSDMKDCPKIGSHAIATDIKDLRINDIKIVAAMGDSITAGMLAKNTNQDNSGASSIANYMRHFQPHLYGASMGQRPARICKETLFCLDSHHDPEIDQLNAAQSGSTSGNLIEQVDYLLKYFGYGTPYVKTWKLIHLMIGYNDASVACLTHQTAADFKSNVKKSLGRLIDKTDYALINLVGLMDYNEILHLADKHPDYKKKFKDNSVNISNYECFCCSRPKAGNPDRSELIREYNKALSELADELNKPALVQLTGAILGTAPKKIAVVFQPMDVIVSSIPYYAMR
ncbi:hypothetical protein BD560DRAFT_322042 [Blakeslea trispora]|nr:hypothetical protein BD560DRAFT_322042 [Blakeslea trispora]